MPINITNIYLNLDTNKPNLKIDERFLQGNADKTLNIKFLKNNEAITITDGIKATLTLVYYNGSNILKKYLISPTLEGGGPNTKYTIPPIANNILTIPFSSDIAFIDHAGKVDLIIKIEDGTSYYTYSCNYNVDTNEAYNTVGIIDNLPSIDNIKTDVTTLKADMSQARTDINTNTQAISNKANSNLSNVGDFSTAQDGALLYKKDGQLKHTPIIIDDTGKVINSPYSLKVPPNTITIGENISLKENGGFINFFTKASGKYYIALDYENNAITGTQKPIYYQRGPVQTKVNLQGVDTTQMNNVLSINLGTANNDVQVQALYLKLVNSVANFKVKLNINSQDVAYYPSKAAWDGNEPGFNLSAGLQKIQLEPFWSTITGFNRTLYIKADAPINLWGNGTLPYVAEDLNTITKKDVALMEDIAGSIIPETGATIKGKLEALTGNDRLSANAVKNLDNISAKLDLTNVLTTDFEKKFMATDAYNKIAEYMNMSHPDALSRAVELEPNDSVNLSTTNGEIIFLDYQFTTNNQVIRQTLPPNSQGKYLMFATVYPNMFDGTQIILSPASGENINDASSDVIITRSGFLGIAIPKDNGYIWVQSTNLSGETGKTIKQKLETLTGANRLDASAIKNLPSGSVKVAKDGSTTPTDVGTMLFPFAQSLDLESGTAAINTAIVVKDENGSIVQNCNSIEVPSQSLISLSEDNTESSNVVIDFKGLPTQTDSASTTKHAYGYLFPDATITGDDGGPLTVNTGVKATLSSPTQDFTEYNKILLDGNHFTLEPKAGESTTLEVGFGGISVESNNVEHPGINLIDFNVNDFNLNGTQPGIAQIELKDKSHNGFMAYYNHRDVIGNIEQNALYRTTSLKPNFVVYNEHGITYDSNSGLISLSYEGDGTIPQVYKVVARATLRRQMKDADLEAYLYLLDAYTNDYLADINGEIGLVHKTIKKEMQYDYVELVTMISIVKTTNFRVIIKDDTPNKYVDIIDMAFGTSAIVVEKVNENNQPSEALNYYELLTQQSMRFIKHTYKKDYETAINLIDESPTTLTTYPADTSFQKDGWVIYYQEEGWFQQDDSPNGGPKCIRMTDNTTTSTYFNVLRVLEFEDTLLLRSKTISAEVDIVEQVGDFTIIPIVWKKRKNEYPFKVISAMTDQGTYTTADGWNVIDASKIDIPAPSVLDFQVPRTIKCDFIVPSDAVNVGFILMPTKKQLQNTIKFTNFRLGCDPTIDVWVIESPIKAFEEQLHKDSKYIKFLLHNTTAYNMSDWYQISNTSNSVNNFQPLYVGEIVAGGTADVTRIYNTASTDFNELHNKGKIKFLKDGRVTIRTTFYMGVDKVADIVDHATAQLWYIKDRGDGDINNGITVPISIHERRLPKAGNVWNDGTRTAAAVDWTFTMDVKANEEYWLACHPIGVPTDAGNEGHIYAYPKGFIEINFLEDEYRIMQLQTLVESLQNQIIFTDNAKATSTKLKVDNAADGSTPTVTATTTP